MSPDDSPPEGPTGDWTDRIVGERMELDQEFAEKVAASHFSRQQWSLIMTAVEFEIEAPAEPERARLVADTSKFEAIVPELERMEQGGPGGGLPGSGGRSGDGSDGLADAATTEESDSGGFLGGVKDALGIGGDDGREQLAAAEEMAQMYADDLQDKLAARGKWETVCAVARDSTTDR